MTKWIGAAILAGAVGIFSGNAQAFPDKPVQLVVPFSPGGGTDVLARLVGQKLSKELGTEVVIDNRSGAGGTIGTSYVAHAKPDGHTVLIFNALPHTAAPNLYEGLDYDPVEDFDPVGSFGVSPYVLVVNPEFPAQDFNSFVELVQSAPGTYNYASAGVGSSTHLAMELLKSEAGLEIVHIPYNGSGPALNDVVAGTVPVAFDSILPVTELAKGGLLTPIAISSEQRSERFPDMPTFDELGLEDLDLAGNWGLAVPAGTPSDVVAVLSEALEATISDPDLSAKLKAQGITPVVSSPEEFEATIKSESLKWARLIEEVGIER